MQAMVYWAHSDRAGLPETHPAANWQRLSEHLENVGALSRKLAQLACPGDEQFHELASYCGLLHDFGKYSECFQKMIRTRTGRCQHAVHGAALSYCGVSQQTGFPRLLHVALAIAGHHAGLPDIKGGEASLDERIKKYREEAVGLVARAAQDSDPIKKILERPFPLADKAVEPRFDLFTRMLFSCLVDADRLDSSGRAISQESLDAAKRLDTLMVYVASLAARGKDGVVKSARQQVLEDCLAAAQFPERLLSLTVPTGGGKTLAAMAFALKRAALQPEAYRRIIVVIPYLSIIEQNAEVYTRIFGAEAILEHHSGSFVKLVRKGEHFAPSPSDSDKDEESYQDPARRNETENWDSPLIVTTSVRFFESLFSNRPSDLRRVHNIARSIVILDEVQTLPRRLLAPLLAMIRELSKDWGCTFVFSTATQPAFERQPDSRPDARWEPGTMREIVQHPDALRASLKRVHIAWEIEELVKWPELARRMLSESQVLTIVNLRDHASTLFDELFSQAQERGFEEGALFHLSTRMCAAHRLAVLERIRRRLDEGRPCRVVSTQLVEAGVDVDFPVVFRALGPLDAIFQAAGRADREGLLTASLGRPGGRVIVFAPEDNRVPPNEYKEARDLTATLADRAMREGTSLQVDSADAIHHYFERYYGGYASLGEELQAMRVSPKFEFAKLADNFEMISNRTRDVFVPYGEGRALVEDLRRIGQLTGELRRRLQRYVVGVLPYEFERARGVLAEIRPESEIWVAVERSYSEIKGLKLQLDAEDLFA